MSLPLIRSFVLALVFACVALPLAAQEPTTPPRQLEPAFKWDPNDPRINLRAGYMDAGEAIRGLTKLASVPRPAGFFNPAQVGDGGFSNTDLAFRGNMIIQGNYTASRRSTSPTRAIRACSSPSSARVGRVTSPCTAISSSCRSSRRAVAPTAAPVACRTR
jgi:hypothetical protein